MQKIKKGDTVYVHVGKDAGKTGKVLQVFSAERLASVEGVNLAIRHLRRRGEKEAGQKVEFPAPLPLAKLAVVCPKCGKPTRVSRKLDAATKRRVRTCRRCGEPIA